jgi:ATP-dependent DNA helicase RecG
MLLKNLHLFDGNYLKRAAILLFHHDPENWVLGAYVKVALLENAADITYQDEIHGPLISIADKVEELVNSKYFKGIISYMGLNRIENFPIPSQAFREAILNAVIHRDFSTGNPIHIHIYPEKVLIYNDGHLPENWTVKDLFISHSSMPYNPLIANTLFRSGQIEAWGRGIEIITNACKEWEKPKPFFKTRTNEVMIGFNTENNPIKNIDLKETQAKIIKLIKSNSKISTEAIATEIGIAPHYIQVHIQLLKDINILKHHGTEKSGVWSIDNIPDNNVDKSTISEKQAKIITLMRTNPKISANDIATAIAQRNVQVHIQSLKAMNVVETLRLSEGREVDRR